MVLLLLTEAITSFVSNCKYSFVDALETLLPSDTNFAPLTLFMASSLLKGRLTFSVMLGISHCNSLLFP